MLDFLLIALFITYLVVLILHLSLWSRILKKDKQQEMAIKELKGEIQQYARLTLMSPADRKANAHQWLVHCAESGNKIPFKEFLSNQTKNQSPNG